MIYQIELCLIIKRRYTIFVNISIKILFLSFVDIQKLDKNIEYNSLMS